MACRYRVGGTALLIFRNCTRTYAYGPYSNRVGGTGLRELCVPLEREAFSPKYVGRWERHGNETTPIRLAARVGETTVTPCTSVGALRDRGGDGRIIISYAHGPNVAITAASRRGSAGRHGDVIVCLHSLYCFFCPPPARDDGGPAGRFAGKPRQPRTRSLAEPGANKTFGLGTAFRRGRSHTSVRALRKSRARRPKRS